VGSRRASSRDGLLVLSAGRAQVDVRIDECGREYEALPVDDAVRVRLEVRPQLGDRAALDADVEHHVHARSRVEHVRTADDEIVAALLAEQHHAAPISCRAAAWTPAGPCVSRS
jgi:hypothetical protein